MKDVVLPDLLCMFMIYHQNHPISVYTSNLKAWKGLIAQYIIQNICLCRLQLLFCFSFSVDCVSKTDTTTEQVPLVEDLCPAKCELVSKLC